MGNSLTSGFYLGPQLRYLDGSSIGNMSLCPCEMHSLTGHHQAGIRFEHAELLSWLKCLVRVLNVCPTAQHMPPKQGQKAVSFPYSMTRLREFSWGNPQKRHQ